MKGIYENWHFWKATKGFLLSNEDTKQLLSFEDIDQIINYLWLNGDKDAARAFHKIQQGSK